METNLRFTLPSSIAVVEPEGDSPQEPATHILTFDSAPEYATLIERLMSSLPTLTDKPFSLRYQDGSDSNPFVSDRNLEDLWTNIWCRDGDPTTTIDLEILLDDATEKVDRELLLKQIKQTVKKDPSFAHEIRRAVHESLPRDHRHGRHGHHGGHGRHGGRRGLGRHGPFPPPPFPPPHDVNGDTYYPPPRGPPPFPAPAPEPYPHSRFGLYGPGYGPNYGPQPPYWNHLNFPGFFHPYAPPQPSFPHLPFPHFLGGRHGPPRGSRHGGNHRCYSREHHEHDPQNKGKKSRFEEESSDDSNSEYEFPPEFRAEFIDPSNYEDFKEMVESEFESSFPLSSFGQPGGSGQRGRRGGRPGARGYGSGRGGFGAFGRRDIFGSQPK